MGSVYLWGLPGRLPLFLGGLPTLPCDMICHVALWLVLDRSGQWGEALGVLLGVYGLQLACGLWFLGHLSWRMGVMVHLFSLPVTTLID